VRCIHYSNLNPAHTLRHGTIFHDLDGRRSRDLGEPHHSRRRVFLDHNNTNLLETGEISTPPTRRAALTHRRYPWTLTRRKLPQRWSAPPAAAPTTGSGSRKGPPRDREWVNVPVAPQRLVPGGHRHTFPTPPTPHHYIGSRRCGGGNTMAAHMRTTLTEDQGQSPDTSPARPLPPTKTSLRAATV